MLSGQDYFRDWKEVTLYLFWPSLRLSLHKLVMMTSVCVRGKEKLYPAKDMDGRGDPWGVDAEAILSSGSRGV